MIPIADIAGMCGMGFFLIATIKQLHKIKKTHHTTAISATHYKLKIIAIFCSLICFALTGLLLSLMVVSAELIVTLLIIYFLNKYRKVKVMTSDQFVKELEKW